MLIYLIALTLLGISRSSPTTFSPTDIPATHQLVDTPSIFAQDVAQCSKRTVAQIYWTCIGTIFACTWAALHPNLPGPRDSSFQQLKRRIVSMYIAIGAPELIVHWSLRQRVAAKRLKDEFNREFFNGVDPEAGKPITATIREWFTGPSEETPSGWTLTHGFFVQMGGFMLYDGKKPVRVLTFKRLVQAIKDQEIDLPDIPVEDIMDKSKRDTLGKFIVVVQTTWFIIQCIARSRSGLPLAELEISTLAFAVLNAIAYGILWSKPQSISVPIKLFLKHLPETLHPQHPQPDPSLSSPRTKVPHTPSVSALPLPSPSSTKDEVTSMEEAIAKPTLLSDLLNRLKAPFLARREIQERQVIEEGQDSKELCDKRSFHFLRGSDVWHLPTFLVVLVAPWFCGFVVLRAVIKPGATFRFVNGRSYVWALNQRLFLVGKSRVPMFYADDSAVGDEELVGTTRGEFVNLHFTEDETAPHISYANTSLAVPSSIIGLIFGAIHLTLWASQDFPSTVVKWLWNASALVVTAEPVFALLSAAFTRGGTPLWAKSIGAVLIFGSSALYIPSRCILIFLSLYTVSLLPPEAYCEVDWTELLPHIF